jgi:menaquinol-cytochrome c reductase cytochrome b subunit
MMGKGLPVVIVKLRSQASAASHVIVGWIEHRTGVEAALEKFLHEPAPKRGAWIYTLGSANLFLITLQFLTGFLLLFYYVPTTDHAWNSVYHGAGRRMDGAKRSRPR